MRMDGLKLQVFLKVRCKKFNVLNDREPWSSQQAGLSSKFTRGKKKKIHQRLQWEPLRPESINFYETSTITQGAGM